MDNLLRITLNLSNIIHIDLIQLTVLHYLALFHVIQVAALPNYLLHVNNNVYFALQRLLLFPYHLLVPLLFHYDLVVRKPVLAVDVQFFADDAGTASINLM